MTTSHAFKRRAATRVLDNAPIRGMNPTATIRPSLRDEETFSHSIAARWLMVGGRFNARSGGPAKIPRRGATVEIDGGL